MVSVFQSVSHKAVLHNTPLKNEGAPYNWDMYAGHACSSQRL